MARTRSNRKKKTAPASTANRSISESNLNHQTVDGNGNIMLNDISNLENGHASSSKPNSHIQDNSKPKSVENGGSKMNIHGKTQNIDRNSKLPDNSHGQDGSLSLNEEGSKPLNEGKSKRRSGNKAKEDRAQLKQPQYTAYMAARAKELKEEGNLLFQNKDYAGAMELYELAIKLTPPDHHDRAVFHSNRAACIMQIRPVQYEAAIHECSLALDVDPGYGRALLRRARALEATGRLGLALQDLEVFLQGDPTNPDALAMANRIRLSIIQANQALIASNKESKEEIDHVQFSDEKTQRTNFQGRPSTSAKSISHMENTTSFSHPSESAQRSLNSIEQTDDGSVLTPCPSSRIMDNPASESSNEKVIHQDNIQLALKPELSETRPLKLVYDHDIRLAEMPVNCTFGNLRKIVKSRFPSAKSILIKYKDIEGDLVTITNTKELRLAESAAAVEATNRNLRVANLSSQGNLSGDKHAIGLPVVSFVLDQVRLQIVDVPQEQEPFDNEELASSMDAPEAVIGDTSDVADSKDTSSESKTDHKDRSIEGEEFDKWLVDFANLFRTHLGIDPNGHVDLHEQGLELCAQALEDVITAEEAHKLFELSAAKFQEIAALAFLNWGNVYMCAARKQIPHSSDDDSMDFCDRLQAAFDWAQKQYALAEEKLQFSLQVKPDYCDAILALGQKDFECAKLHWSLAIATEKDLSLWDSSKMMELFHKAEKRMEKAAEILEKQESHNQHPKDSVDAKKKENESNETSSLEQDLALKMQIYLLWGNLLYEHSQVEFRLGKPSWKERLDTAVHKFEIAGASPSDIETALEKHLSSSSVFLDTSEADHYHQNKHDDAKPIIEAREPNLETIAEQPAEPTEEVSPKKPAEPAVEVSSKQPTELEETPSPDKLSNEKGESAVAEIPTDVLVDGQSREHLNEEVQHQETSGVEHLPNIHGKTDVAEISSEVLVYGQSREHLNEEALHKGVYESISPKEVIPTNQSQQTEELLGVHLSSTEKENSIVKLETNAEEEPSHREEPSREEQQQNLAEGLNEKEEKHIHQT